MKTLDINNWNYKYKHLFQKNSDSNGISAIFLGVSTIYFYDKRNSILIDGFFSRPSLEEIKNSYISPNKHIIDESLNRLGIKKLDAVICSHSHWDHAMDSAYIALRTKSLLIGSKSTLNIGLGSGLEKSQMRLIKDNDILQFGNIKIKAIKSLHSHGDKYKGFITKPLIYPTHVSELKTGGCFTFIIEYKNKTISHQSSANFIPGKLLHENIDVAYVSSGTLGKVTIEFFNNYWNEMILIPKVKRIIPIHWDNFFIPISQPITPMGEPFDNFDRAMELIINQANHDGVEVQLPVIWQNSDPFANIQ